MTPGVVVPRVSVMVEETVMMAPTKIHYFAEVREMSDYKYE